MEPSVVETPTDESVRGAVLVSQPFAIRFAEGPAIGRVSGGHTLGW